MIGGSVEASYLPEIPGEREKLARFMPPASPGGVRGVNASSNEIRYMRTLRSRKNPVGGESGRRRPEKDNDYFVDSNATGPTVNR